MMCVSGWSGEGRACYVYKSAAVLARERLQGNVSGIVNMQDFVWMFLCVIYINFHSFIHIIYLDGMFITVSVKLRAITGAVRTVTGLLAECHCYNWFKEYIQSEMEIIWGKECIYFVCVAECMFATVCVWERDRQTDRDCLLFLFVCKSSAYGKQSQI